MPHVTCVRHLRFCAPQPAVEPCTTNTGSPGAVAMQGGVSCHGPPCKHCGLTRRAHMWPQRGVVLSGATPSSGSKGRTASLAHPARANAVSSGAATAKTASAKAVGCHECGRVTTWCHGGLARNDVRLCTHRTFRLAKAAPECVAHASGQLRATTTALLSCPAWIKHVLGPRATLRKLSEGRSTPRCMHNVKYPYKTRVRVRAGAPGWAHGVLRPPLRANTGSPGALAMQEGAACHGPPCKHCGLTRRAQGRPQRGAALSSDMPASGAQGRTRRARAPRARQRGVTRSCYSLVLLRQRLWGCHKCGRVSTWCHGGQRAPMYVHALTGH